MFRNRWRAGLIAVVGLGFLAAPDRVAAQYNCAVTIELDGKGILRGTIIDVERPPTEQLWQTLNTLSFSGSAKADPQNPARATLKGDLRVIINGAGDVKLNELRLVQNKYNASAWVIAPEDVAQILKLRKEADKK